MESGEGAAVSRNPRTRSITAAGINFRKIGWIKKKRKLLSGIAAPREPGMCQLSRARKGCGAPSFQPGNDAAAICFAGRYLELRRAKSRLAPVAFDKHVIVPAMLPPMIHPSRMRPRRRHPHPCRPHVRMAIPAMIAALVDIAALRSPAAHFDHRARRRHLHNNLGAHRADRQQAARNCGKNCSSHFFPSLVDPRGSAAVSKYLRPVSLPCPAPALRAPPTKDTAFTFDGPKKSAIGGCMK